MKAQQPLLEVAIVGGGPAGLSAALLLGRCRRRVLLCDEGRPRNAAARQFNGFLSRDATSPAEFLSICRNELKRYPTVESRSARVVDVERGPQHFTLVLDSGEHIEARMLLLATGVVDKLPAIQGLTKFYGKTVHNCPYCDGWECRDQPLAVIGGDEDAAGLAIELTQWSHDIVLCPPRELVCGEKTLKQLRRKSIQIVDKPVQGIEGEGETLHGLRFTDGSWLSRAALFFSPVQRQRGGGLAERLGCKFGCPGEGILCADDTQTSIPGVYAAGNASKGVQMVIVAAAEGTRAAIAINNPLTERDAEAEGPGGMC